MASSLLDTFSCAARMAARTAVACITSTSFCIFSTARRSAPVHTPAPPSGPRVLWRPDWAPAPPADSVSSACSSAPSSSVSADSSDAASIASEMSATLEAGEAEASAQPEGFHGFTILSVGEQLGAGAFGKVQAVQIKMADGTIRDAVLKTLRDHVSESVFDREVKALEAARGVPYVVQMYGACKTADRSCIVLERVKGVSLHAYLLKATEERGKRRRTLMPYAQIAKLGQQLFTAVRELHSRGFAHNDVKLDNIMLREGSNDLCLLDLGNASWTDSEGHLLTPGGTLTYMGDEVEAAVFSKHTAYPYKPTLASDLFSCGVVIACATEYGIYTTDVRGMLDYQLELPSYVPDDLTDLMFGCMDDVPPNRYTAQDAAAHPFLQRMLAT